MMSSSKWKTFTVPSCTRIRDRRQMEKYPVSAFLTPSVTHFSCIRKQRCREEGTSPVVQWLRLCLSMQGLQVQSLVKELRSYMPHGQQTKAKVIAQIGEIDIKIPTNHIDIVKDSKACNTTHQTKGAVYCLINDLCCSVFDHLVSSCCSLVDTKVK